MNSHSWNEMVFSNRNQSYGAYLLRKAYPSRVTMSFAFAMITVSMILASPMIREMFTDEVVKKIEPPIIDGSFRLEPPPLIPDIPQPKDDVAPPKTIKVLPPRVTNEDVIDDVPENAEIANALVSPSTNEGVLPLTDPVPIPEVKIAPVEDVIVSVPEVQPEFPGGYAAMMKFIGANTKYPSVARRLEIEGTAFISFVVDSDGTIDDVQVMRGLFDDCDKEAMRVISKMPLWKPGKQNGKAVKVRFVLPFKFKLDR